MAGVRGLCLWTILAMIVAAYLLKRRDARGDAACQLSRHVIAEWKMISRAHTLRLLPDRVATPAPRTALEGSRAMTSTTSAHAAEQMAVQLAGRSAAGDVRALWRRLAVPEPQRLPSTSLWSPTFPNRPADGSPRHRPRDTSGPGRWCCRRTGTAMPTASRCHCCAMLHLAARSCGWRY